MREKLTTGYLPDLDEHLRAIRTSPSTFGSIHHDCSRRRLSSGLLSHRRKRAPRAVSPRSSPRSNSASRRKQIWCATSTADSVSTAPAIPPANGALRVVWRDRAPACTIIPRNGMTKPFPIRLMRAIPSSCHLGNRGGLGMSVAAVAHGAKQLEIRRSSPSLVQNAAAHHPLHIARYHRPCPNIAIHRDEQYRGKPL